MVSLSTIAFERRVGVEVLLEPGEGEFHHCNAGNHASIRPRGVGKSSGRKP